MALTIRNPRARQRVLEAEEPREEYHVQHPFLELRLTHSAGLGLFATTAIKRGTRILAEIPLLVVPRTTLPFFLFSEHQAELSAKELDELYNLQAEPYPNREYRRRFKNLLVAANPLSLPPEKLEEMVDNEVLVWNIIQNNAISIRASPRSMRGLAIFPLASRLNHSCAPNAYASYNPDLGQHTVHAIRVIAADEEINIAYVDPAQGIEARSRCLDEKHNFDCACDFCTSPLSTKEETFRSRLGGIIKALEIYSHGSAAETKQQVRLTHPVPHNPTQAFALADECIALLRATGLESMVLARVYRYKASFALQLGLVDVAREAANEEAKIEMTCLGAETGWMNDGVDDGAGNADMWKRKIEEVAEKDRVKIKMCEKRGAKEVKKAEKKAAKKAKKNSGR